MLKFTIGLITGCILGVCLMCCLFVGSEEDRILGLDDAPEKTDNTERK